MKPIQLYLLLSAAFLISSCKDTPEGKNPEQSEPLALLVEQPENIPTPEGMVWIPGGKFQQGAVASDKMAMHHEKPAHPVAVGGFFMDITEVTNAEFRKFVEETGYITVAEREIVWERWPCLLHM